MSSRSIGSRAGNPSPEPASVALLEAVLAAILRAIGEMPAALAALEEGSAARPAPSILIDYLTPQELAAELHIKENHLAIWKREGFGPPRTRIRQLVMYRREAVLRWLLGLEEGHQG
jgi:hypothetical protein